MVRQAQVDRRDPEGGDDQRGVGAGRYRRLEQGSGRRSRASGTRRRLCRHRLCHRDGDGVGRRSAHRRREAAAGREGHSGPRLHRDGRDHQRRGRLAGIIARPCLRQCPAAADLHAQSRPHDSPVSGVGGAGTRRALRSPPAAVRQDRRLDPVPVFPSCRRCRPYADRRPDRRGQVGAAGADGLAVPALCRRAGLRLRLRRLNPRGGARHARRLARSRRRVDRGQRRQRIAATARPRR